MSCCESSTDCIPALIVVIALFCSYYIYVVELCVYTVDTTAKKIVYLCFFHMIFLLVVWCYFTAMCTSVGMVPEEYRLPQKCYNALKEAKGEKQSNAILKKFCEERKIKVYTVSVNGSIRYCQKCKQVKPDRTHHCSTCKTCVLKMDHHCPWVNNCVCYFNYKAFILTLIYSCVYIFFYCGSAAEYFVNFWIKGSDRKISQYSIIVAFIMCFVVGFFVFFLLVYHLSLLFKNVTTLETMQELEFVDESLSFDLGPWDNFLEVFGLNCWLWWLPLDTSLGDGCEFPMQYDL